MKKGDTAYTKCIGYGLTTYEAYGTVDKINKIKGVDYVWIDPYEPPFKLSDGKRYEEDPAGLGLVVRLCVTEAQIEVAKKYIARQRLRE